MYAKIIALFALLAAVFAAPAPEPAPQAVFSPYYGVDYISPYSYGAYPASPVLPYAAASPILPYSAYSGAYFVKK